MFCAESGKACRSSRFGWRSAKRLPGQRAAGLLGHWVSSIFAAISLAPGSSDGAAAAIAGSGCEPGALRLSAFTCAPEAGGLASECEANLASLQRGRSVDPATDAAPSACLAVSDWKTGDHIYRKRYLGGAGQGSVGVADGMPAEGIDFLSDALFDGRPFRLLGVIDCHTREALAIAPRASFRAFQVAITRSRVSSRSLIWIIPAIARHLEHSDDSVPQRHFYRGRV